MIVFTITNLLGWDGGPDTEKFPQVKPECVRFHRVFVKGVVIVYSAA
jgi:hypothetical protein